MFKYSLRSNIYERTRSLVFLFSLVILYFNWFQIILIGWQLISSESMNCWATIFFFKREWENTNVCGVVCICRKFVNWYCVSWQWQESWWVVTSELYRVYAANYSHWMIIVSFIIISLVVWTGLRPQIRFPSWKLNLWLWRCLCTWNIVQTLTLEYKSTWVWTV